MCDDNSCPICMDVMDTTKNCIITECGHRFHASCLMQNVVHNGFGCPYCRTAMANDDDDSTESTEIVSEFGSENELDDEQHQYSNESLVGFRSLFRRNDPNNDENDDESDTDTETGESEHPDIGYVIQKFREKYQYEDLVKIICFDYDFRMCDDSAPTMDDAFDYIENISSIYERNVEIVA